MDGTRFDHLTRRFAEGSTRRRVVKALGGGVAGAVLAAVGRNATEAANNGCAHVCNAIFPPGPDRGKCKSDGAKHVPGNLCDACGNDPANFCDGVCCAEGSSCCGGSCCPDGACEDDVCCAGGEICNGDCCSEFAPLCCPDESGENVCSEAIDGNCGACGVTCAGTVVDLGGGAFVSLHCCGESGCGLLTGSPCIPDSPIAQCCNLSTCVPSPDTGHNPTGHRCCLFPGGDCSTGVPCCEEFVCNDEGQCVEAPA